MDRTDAALSRRVAWEFAAHLNRALNTTISDSRLSVTPITGSSDVFELTRIVDRDAVSLQLDGTTMRLFVEHVVVVKQGTCRTESYSYRLQLDESPKSWLIRWEYTRNRPRGDYPYPLAHVHINGHFIDGAPTERVHIAGRRVPLELVVRNLISDWGVKPRTDDWGSILEESMARGFDEPV